MAPILPGTRAAPLALAVVCLAFATTPGLASEVLPHDTPHLDAAYDLLDDVHAENRTTFLCHRNRYVPGAP